MGSRTGPEPDDPTGDPRRGDVETRAYEPPAIAWEEPFEPVAATSCGLTPGFELQCAVKPQV
jgi:hypothetical protein